MNLPALKILKTAGWQGPGPAWFVLVRTPDGTNLLLCFEEADGRWVQRFHTAAAVPQGKTAVDYLYVSEQSQSFVDTGYTGYTIQERTGADD